MTSSIAFCTLIGTIVIVVVLSLANPSALSDQNTFLKNFVTHEFLSLLGVILAITIASAGQLHLALRQMESRHRKPDFLSGARTKVRHAAFALIYLFVAGFLIVLAKPLAGTNPTYLSLFNGAAIFVLVWNILILASLTEAAFAIIEPAKPESDEKRDE